ncbi:hypothetical protein [Pseudomonas schmalbachii]|uniref:N-formylglutamate amidohydrolase n=1 Tax=Pseudomonas schmalbachii TaxID=2816993 RepID=A0ABS3TJT7_9PSED|nr:hypothetical protein [Pseudomonas schmalbachii]MBO3273910.1 hypothetical protein [Pseudomonas schmalbachii]
MALKRAPALLVIGIHREELAFGERVAEGVDPAWADVQRIPDGLSGRHPRADQRFHHELLHAALYEQLLPLASGRYRVLIDLHSGRDHDGPSVDLYCGEPRFGRALDSALVREGLDGQGVEVVPLGEGVATVIPRRIWANPDFLYVGMEVYLPDGDQDAAVELARRLVVLVSREAQDFA